VSVDITGRSAPTFDDVLEAPARSSSLSTGGFLMDASVGINYRLAMAEEDGTSTGGLLLGVEVGYTLQPGSSSWKLDGLNDVAGGPDFKLEGLHIRASIGGWGRREPDAGAANQPEEAQ
jgi:hypothetical protein